MVRSKCRSIFEVFNTRAYDGQPARPSFPAGETMSYGQLAANLGRAGASRAVGAANGANPISIVVPCHRVIGANGTLTGYASGLSRKRWLLDHEQRSAVADHARSGALSP